MNYTIHAFLYLLSFSLFISTDKEKSHSGFRNENRHLRRVSSVISPFGRNDKTKVKYSPWFQPWETKIGKTLRSYD